MRARWLQADFLQGRSGDLLADGYSLLHRAATFSAPENPRSRRASNAAFIDHVARMPLRLGLPIAECRHAERIAKLLQLGLGDVRLSDASLRCLINSKTWQLGEEVDYEALLSLEPQDLLRRSYAVLLRRKDYPRTSIPDFFVLILIGLAASGLRVMRYCEFCPRWAYPGATLCVYHSQSRLAPGTPWEKAERYRFGRIVGETYRRRVPRVPAGVLLTSATLATYVAHLLWRTSGPGESRTATAVRRQILESPGLQTLIGVDFGSLGNDRLYSRLQETVDPFEVRPSAWLWKLRLLRLWLGFGTALAARPRKTSLHAWWRLVQGSFLEKEGFSNSEIARELEVSPSTISKWLSRHGTTTLQEAVRRQVDAGRVSYRRDKAHSSLDDETSKQ